MAKVNVVLNGDRYTFKGKRKMLLACLNGLVHLGAAVSVVAHNSLGIVQPRGIDGNFVEIDCSVIRVNRGKSMVWAEGETFPVNPLELTDESLASLKKARKKLALRVSEA